MKAAPTGKAHELIGERWTADGRPEDLGGVRPRREPSGLQVVGARSRAFGRGAACAVAKLARRAASSQFSRARAGRVTVEDDPRGSIDGAACLGLQDEVGACLFDLDGVLTEADGAAARRRPRGRRCSTPLPAVSGRKAPASR